MKPLVERFETAVSYMEALGWQTTSQDTSHTMTTGQAYPEAVLELESGGQVVWAFMRLWENAQFTQVHVWMKVGVVAHDRLCKSIFQKQIPHALHTEILETATFELNRAVFQRLTDSCIEICDNFEGIIFLQNLVGDAHTRRHQPGNFVAALVYNGETELLEAYARDCRQGRIAHELGDECFERAIDLCRAQRARLKG